MCLSPFLGYRCGNAKVAVLPSGKRGEMVAMGNALFGKWLFYTFCQTIFLHNYDE